MKRLSTGYFFVAIKTQERLDTFEELIKKRTFIKIQN